MFDCFCYELRSSLSFKGLHEFLICRIVPYCGGTVQTEGMTQGIPQKLTGILLYFFFIF